MTQQSNFPDFVDGSPQSRIIFRLLSNFADQYNKNMYWIKSQHKIYLRRFERIPSGFLADAFLDYLTFEMPQFLPPVTKVAEYVEARDGYNSNWLRLESGVRYCRQCRTDEEGLEGGIRQIYYYGFLPDVGRVGERTYMSKCNCEAGIVRSGVVYTEVCEGLQRQGGPEAEVCYSFFSVEEGRTITAKEQSKNVWRQRVESGTYEDNGDGTYSPNFNHPIWSTSLGFMIAEMYNMPLPEHLEEVKQRREDERRREAALKRQGFRKRLGEQVAQSQRRGGGPKSLGDLL